MHSLCSYVNFNSRKHELTILGRDYRIISEIDFYNIKESNKIFELRWKRENYEIKDKIIIIKEIKNNLVIAISLNLDVRIIDRKIKNIVLEMKSSSGSFNVNP
jgi:hypothetical protein